MELNYIPNWKPLGDVGMLGPNVKNGIVDQSVLISRLK